MGRLQWRIIVVPRRMGPFRWWAAFRNNGIRGSLVAGRISKLVYSEIRMEQGHSQSADGESLYRCDDGVPLLWIFCFGGRNIWDPGDDIQARGGAMGQRNPYETPIDVAITRLEQAEAALLEDEHLWPWLSAMPVLRRKLMTKPKKGFVRLVAPWIAGLGASEYEQWRRSTAYAENCVNFVNVGRVADARSSLAVLTPYCPLVPLLDGKDFNRLSAAKSEGDEEAVRLAFLTIGVPENKDLLAESARREIAPLLEKARSLPPPKAPSPAEKKAESAPADAVAAAPSGGLLGKLGGLFRKK